jgi:hypothetical protein
MGASPCATAALAAHGVLDATAIAAVTASAMADVVAPAARALSG